MNYEDINIALERHKLWLEHKSGGKRLILSSKDLSNMVLRDKNFSKCVAINTDFKGADLRNCNFEEAILDGADLTYANVQGAIFDGTSMIGTKSFGMDFGIKGIANIKTIDKLLEEGREQSEKIVYDSRHQLSEEDLDDIGELHKDKIAERQLSSIKYEDDNSEDDEYMEEWYEE